MSKINYADKQPASGTGSPTPNQKFTASDANEIKNSVNSLYDVVADIETGVTGPAGPQGEPGPPGVVDPNAVQTFTNKTISGSNNILENISKNAITGLNTDLTNINNAITARQLLLVSGTNVKTINNQTVLGAGNITTATVEGTETFLNKTINGSLNTITNVPLANILGLVAALGGKQDTLVSGTNIKTINSISLLGSGNIVTNNAADLTGTIDEARLPSSVTRNTIAQTLTNKSIDGASNTLTNIAQASVVGLVSDLAGKQATLVSGTTIKTINGFSLLGSGDIEIGEGGGGSNNAADLTTGTLADARLSINVAMLTATQTLTNKTMSGTSNTFTNIPQSAITNLATTFATKQDTLVSGTNIKTFNGNSVLGTGNIVIPDSALFVDLTAAQSIGGNKTFTGSTALGTVTLSGNITLPNSTLNIGSTSARLANIYATNFLSGGGVTFGTTVTNQAISFRQGSSGVNVGMFALSTGNLHLFAPGANPTDQGYRLHVDGTTKITNSVFLDSTAIPTYDSNDLAIAGGVLPTQLYKTINTEGEWIIKMAHSVVVDPIFGEKVNSGSARIFWPGTPIEQSWKFQSANENHNARKATNRLTTPVYRFEINSGETWATDEANGNGNTIDGVLKIKERTECYQENTSIAPNLDVWISYSMYIEPGNDINYTNANWYCILGQWHAGDSIPTSGPSWQFELSGQGNIMLSTRGQENLVPPFVAGRPYSVERHNLNLNRGEWYHIVTRTRHNKNTGQMDWWVNSSTGTPTSTPVYSGTNLPIGYEHTAIGYWKFGIYRTANPNNLAVRYANMEIKVDATNSNAVNSNTLKGRITAPLPI